AHIDHCGKVPYLVKRGFKGKVYATAATVDLAEIMLADSGHIQEEDAIYWNTKRARTKEEEIQALYTIEDAKKAMRHFQKINYDQTFAFGDGARATYLEAGHILGSACILIELTKPEPMTILFTGDMGRFEMPILRDPIEPLPKVDYLITESTYADRRHHNPTDMKEELARIINETRAVGGKVIIPSFSVGRTQNVLYYIELALREGLIDPLPVFVDSPLSTNATEIFKKHPECYDKQTHELWKDHGGLFGNSKVRFITSVEESKALNYMDEPCVILAASGMCESGRILHHLKNNVTEEKNTVCIVGFMAQHTLGRRLVERRQEIKIYGRLYPMMARLELLNGFSAHADSSDFERLYAPIAKDLKAAFVVHGEGPQPIAMKNTLHRLGCANVIIPDAGDMVRLDQLP
ncbi:MAG: MBL fold metallo-hydrolase, partial [Phycisphaerales bacterium]|nr:MBL fold metallo-hydrolase [Phycisphaerales bacterium]